MTKSTPSPPLLSARPETLSIREVRRILMARQGLRRRLRGRLAGPDLAQMVENLGFVQVDSIDTLARAHHGILFARHGGYRPALLADGLERRRTLFENWTHDAAILPAAFWPVWRRHFEREAGRLAHRWRERRGEAPDRATRELLSRITNDGPVKARDLAPEKRDGPAGGWWNWHPGKAALEYLWRTGQLAVTRREGFEKVYDLPERVLPATALEAVVPSRSGMIDWACREALIRLGVATPTELAEFWGIITVPEAKAWAAEQGGDIDRLQIVPDGKRKLADTDAPRLSLVHPSVLEEPVPNAPSGIRVISPFDPVIRDRKRALRLFGFDYRIEVFVPAAKRRYGYYVFPLLDGERFVARIDMKADRKSGFLVVRNVFWEAGVRVTQERLVRVQETLSEIAVWAGLSPEIIGYPQ